MNIKSLGYQMDLAFPMPGGDVIDRGDYLVIHTPSLPGFYWGNYVLFPDPPGPQDFDRWRDLFHKEIGNQPAIEHEAFGWDSPSGELGSIEPFRNAGFGLSQCGVMTVSEVCLPPYFNRDVIVRPVVTDDEWEKAARCTAGATVTDRIKRKMDSWRAMSQSDTGNWYGAFLDGEFVGGLGVYKVDETGVIDEVATLPDFQGQGVGRSLVYQACVHSLQHLELKQLLLMADNGGAAMRMYEQLGFRTVEQQVGILKT